MDIEGAIFDVDGTLLDSMPVWKNIGKDYLISRGIKPHKDINEKLKNMSLCQAAHYYKAEYGIEDSIEKIMDGINDMLAYFYNYKAQVKEGVPEFLHGLKKSHVKMCVATATDHRLVAAALKRNRIIGYFGRIFTCTDIGHGKDEPDIYNAALAFLGTPKSCTWVFEDALYAVNTAKKAGFNVTGVYDRFEKDHSAVRKKANIYINSFNEMRNFFD